VFGRLWKAVAQALWLGLRQQVRKKMGKKQEWGKDTWTS
jgi:hypothetical protein